MPTGWVNRTGDSGSIDALHFYNRELRFIVCYIQAARSQSFDQRAGAGGFGGIVTGSIMVNRFS